ncbi:MAG: AMIN domain-containing protein [Sulfurimonas sp.]|nr:AMIN domain-containing protein [Sulfurimonas sp.]
MVKVLLISILLFTTINARENPFFAIMGEKDIPISSNKDRTKPPLKRATITLPSQARILQKVTIEFKNIDGSIESKSIELDNAVDWHLPIFISQSYSTQVDSIPVVKKSTIKKDIKPKVKPQSKSQEKEKFDTITSVKHLTLLSSGKKLKLITKDTIIRDFLLVNPHRIVIDFKKDTNIKSYVKNIEEGVFKKVKIGNHKGYYRAVIELDGIYRYDIRQTPYGYFLELL